MVTESRRGWQLLTDQRHEQKLTSTADRLLPNLAARGLLISHGREKYGMTDFTRSLAQADQVAAFSYSRRINSAMIE